MWTLWSRGVQAGSELEGLKIMWFYCCVFSWKARTNHLIEQCERCDPEEYKQALKDREELRQTVNSLKEEINKHQVDKVNLNMQIAQLKNEETLTKKKVGKNNYLTPESCQNLV